MRAQKSPTREIIDIIPSVHGIQQEPYRDLMREYKYFALYCHLCDDNSTNILYPDRYLRAWTYILPACRWSYRRLWPPGFSPACRTRELSYRQFVGMSSETVIHDHPGADQTYKVVVSRCLQYFYSWFPAEQYPTMSEMGEPVSFCILIYT